MCRCEITVVAHFDAAVLAQAGLSRLGLAERASQVFDADELLPSVGQGALVIEARAGDAAVLELLKSISHDATRLACETERAFMARLGGGCQLPVGAYARCLGDLMLMTLFLSSPDGGKAFRSKLEGLALDPLQMAGDAYLAVVERGGRELLELDNVEQHKTGLEE